MVMILFHAISEQQFGDDILQEFELVEIDKAFISAFRAQDADQLVTDALSRDKFDASGQLGDRPLGLFFDQIIELRREAYGTQHAQSIFAESVLRLPYRADCFLLDIFLPSEKIDNLAIAHGHGVDCEVAPLEILLYVILETHFIRMSPIAITLLAAVSSYLDNISQLITIAQWQDNGTEIILILGIRKNFQDFLRPCDRGNIIILGLYATDKVTQRTANQKGLISGLLELFDYFCNFTWNFQHVFLVSLKFYNNILPMSKTLGSVAIRATP